MANDTLSDCGPVTARPKVPVPPDRRDAERRLTAIAGVHGVGEGRDDIGDRAWVAYVRDARVAATLPSHVAGRPVVAEITGEIGAFPAGV